MGETLAFLFHNMYKILEENRVARDRNPLEAVSRSHKMRDAVCCCDKRSTQVDQNPVQESHGENNSETSSDLRSDHNRTAEFARTASVEQTPFPCIVRVMSRTCCTQSTRVRKRCTVSGTIEFLLSRRNNLEFSTVKNHATTTYLRMVATSY